MSKLFIATASAQDKALLKELGFSWKRHKDGDRNGILLLEPISRTKFAKLVKTNSDLKVTLDSAKAINQEITAITLCMKNCKSSKTSGQLKHPDREIVKLATHIRSSYNRGYFDDAEDMTEFSREYSKTVQEFKAHHREYCAALSLPFQAKSELEKELDAICRHPQVTEVTFSARDKGLCIHTTTLCCKHPKTGNIHTIGSFIIRFAITKCSNEQSIQFRNLDPIAAGLNCQAPHVFHNGVACLGSLKTTLPELLSQGLYFAAVDMAIAFIESVNRSDSWGIKNLESFPICSPPGNLTSSSSQQTVKRGYL